MGTMCFIGNNRASALSSLHTLRDPCTSYCILHQTGKLLHSNHDHNCWFLVSVNCLAKCSILVMRWIVCMKPIPLAIRLNRLSQLFIELNSIYEHDDSPKTIGRSIYQLMDQRCDCYTFTCGKLMRLSAAYIILSIIPVPVLC